MTETLLAINTLVTLIETATSAMTAAQAVSALIKKAKEEGRDVTQAELDELVRNDNDARFLLTQAIDLAQKGT